MLMLHWRAKQTNKRKKWSVPSPVEEHGVDRVGVSRQESEPLPAPPEDEVAPLVRVEVPHLVLAPVEAPVVDELDAPLVDQVVHEDDEGHGHARERVRGPGKKRKEREREREVQFQRKEPIKHPFSPCPCQ